MNMLDVEALQEAKEATVRASELMRSISESLQNAGRFTESGRWVEHRHGTPLEWPVHGRLRHRVEHSITEVRRMAAVAWEYPSGFNLRMLKAALIELEALGRMLVHADALRTVAGEQDALRLIELDLSR